jgi:hypothetical protein
MSGGTDDLRDGGARLDEDRPVLIRTTADDRPVVVHGPADDQHGAARGRRRALAAALVILLAVAAATAWLLLRGGDDDVAATPAPGAAADAGPAPLSLAVQVPERVVAGTPVTVTVTYEDGAGTYAGSQEDWGDGVGTGSLKQGPCGSVDSGAPLTGSYQATHTWTEPGSYPLTVAVTSYTCENGVAVEEQASRTVTVDVARG